jgi:hypothetical protein|tara:strand:+ start:279 stop:593 length:315 start_codon:yes stop_codon:yes gene_type:complete
MAITELTRIERALRTVASNSPSIGCGGTFCSAGKALLPGDYVMIHVTSATAVTLSSIEWLSSPIVDFGGTEVASLVLQPNTTTAINIMTCSVVGGTFIAYNRCH